ncbi:acyl carrier protein [Kineococcus sp. SYSU DK003]|uniref:acyl carrier protein n=1 Tax=Kineococcus sp. SYSU DK003 TaxID=3383124 RepID=UPI003D7CBBEE
MTVQNSTFTLEDLMDLLVAKVGLPASARTDDPDAMFTDLGLDSLAFLQLQTELQQTYGVPVDENAHAEDHSLGAIVHSVRHYATIGAQA